MRTPHNPSIGRSDEEDDTQEHFLSNYKNAPQVAREDDAGDAEEGMQLLETAGSTAA